MADIRAKKPRIRAGDQAALQLTAEERFLMSRIDGHLSVGDLSGLTGLAPARVEQIVSRLAGAGAVELTEDESGEKASLAEFAAALGMDPSAFGATPAAAKPPPPPPPPPVAAREPSPVLRRYTPAKPFPSAEPVPLVDDSASTNDAGSTDDAASTDDAPPDANDAGDAADAGADDAGEASDTNLEDPEVNAAQADAKRDEDEVDERNYRAVYETRWHPLPLDQRIAGARGAEGADLLALCFDQDARVIGAVFENTGVALDHARLVAFHHRTGTGLEVLARRQDWLRDILVERRLLRNPMLGTSVLGRVIGPKTLHQTYKITMDRDVPDLTRTKCRGHVRQKWQSASSEERADLLVRTEARCLAIMSGCTFDAKTTGILCGRPINSAMFVQSVAKFGASPPGLLAHLIKQPFVRKNVGLKKMLLAHPNMPGDVKRSI